MDISQLAGLIQLREAATAVNKKDFPSLIQHNAGAWMRRNRRGRSEQETNPANQWTVFMSATYPDGAVNCQTNIKQSMSELPVKVPTGCGKSAIGDLRAWNT